MIPIQVWAGFELGTSNYLFAIALIGIVMVLDFIGIQLWIDAQTEDINHP